MRRCVLDGDRLDSAAAVHAVLAAALAFPPHYGGNLDALWDVLTRDLAGPAEIVWLHADRSRARLGAEYDRLARVLTEAAAANPALRVSFA
jgi:ribonuclease inhibitor